MPELSTQSARLLTAQGHICIRKAQHPASFYMCLCMSLVKAIKRQYPREQILWWAVHPWLHTRSRSRKLEANLNSSLWMRKGRKRGASSLSQDGMSIGKKDNLDMLDWQTLLDHVSATTATRCSCQEKSTPFSMDPVICELSEGENLCNVPP